MGTPILGSLHIDAAVDISRCDFYIPSPVAGMPILNHSNHRPSTGMPLATSPCVKAWYGELEIMARHMKMGKMGGLISTGDLL